jgi:protein ImuA
MTGTAMHPSHSHAENHAGNYTEGSPWEKAETIAATIARGDTAGNDNATPPALAQASDRKAPTLTTLRQTIARLERGGQAPETELEPAHTPDACAIGQQNLPSVPLPYGWVHEIWARTPADMQAATALMLAASGAAGAAPGTEDSMVDKPVLWVSTRMLLREHGLPYGPGLKACGIDPARVLLVRCETEQDALWTLEEALKSTALASVVGEVGTIDLTASRRLTLVARTHGTRCLLLLRSADAPSSAAYSRWQAAAASSRADPFDARAPGPPRLSAQLHKHRGGLPPASTTMEWPDHAPDTIPLVPAVADRPLAEAPPSVGHRAAG